MKLLTRCIPLVVLLVASAWAAQTISAESGMTLIQAAILGVVEGVTEYLPVSSTGHLIVAQRLMGIGRSEAAEAYAICIQAGAIAAVAGLYRRRVAQMARGLLGADPAGRALAINIVVAFIPALVLGFAASKTIKKYLFGGETWGLWPIIGAWAAGGAAILAVARWRKRGRSTEAAAGTGLALEQLNWRMAAAIGAAQCLAMWPGVSRSLITIVGGLVMGLSMSAAVEFSFLLGVLTLTAATAYDGLKHGSTMMQEYGPGALAIGFITATVSAAVAVKWMVHYLQRHGLWLFGWYRIGIAAVIGAMVVFKRI